MASEMERNEPRKFSPVCSRSLKSRSGTTISVELKEIRKGHFWEQCLKGNKKCPEQEARGGRTPIWNRRGCSSEILNLTPKGDHLGVA